VKAAPMAFKAPHVSFLSFGIEVLPSGITQVMIVETDLHLNQQHPSYNRSAVETLISAAKNYVSGNIEGPAIIRLVSTASGEF
jgi:hypothetical protein